MKDFALQLEGCSKEDRKKVIKAMKKAGLKWIDSDRFKDNVWKYLSFEKNMYYLLGRSFISKGKPIYQMPRDWEKIQEALGVKVEPKDGEVWKLEEDSKSGIFRYQNEDVTMNYYSAIRGDDSSFTSYGNIIYTSDKNSWNFRKATPEEEAKLIETEHANGYHWTGSELVEIPEYIEDIHSNKIYPVQEITLNGKGYIPRDESLLFIGIDLCEPSTREAYEAQETKKKMQISMKSLNMQLAGIAAGAATKGLIEACKKLQESHPTPSEAINSPKRLAQQVEKLEKEVFELREENKRLRKERNDFLVEKVCFKGQLKEIASQPEIIDQVKKMITE